MMALCGCETQDKQIQTSLPEVQIENAIAITQTSAVLQGKVSNNAGRSEDILFYFEWAEDSAMVMPHSTDADTISLAKDAGTTVSCRISELTPGTKYYYRACLAKFSGRYSRPVYSTIGSFTTDNVTPSITVVTKENTSVTSCTARSHGTATATGCTIKETGLLLITDGSTPTTSNYLQKRSGTYTAFVGFWYNLQPSKTHRVRAYAIDEKGTVYYGETRSFTTKSEPGGSLTVSDFEGTYTVNAYSPWESKNVTWTSVKIAVYNQDTVIASGWDDNSYFLALGIFDKGRQIVRFESNWYWKKKTFTYEGTTCIGMFIPVYYNSSDQDAYLIQDGGRDNQGEIWLKKTGTNTFQFAASDGDDQYGRYANGFVFLYITPEEAEEKGYSSVYTNVKFTRTSTSTTAPLRMPGEQEIQSIQTINTYGTQDALDDAVRHATYRK